MLDGVSAACLDAVGVLVTAVERDGVAISDPASSTYLLITGVVLGPEARNEVAIPDHASSSCAVAGIVVAALAFSDVWISSGSINIAINI